jgi:hypothetical protein
VVQNPVYGFSFLGWVTLGSDPRDDGYSSGRVNSGRVFRPESAKTSFEKLGRRVKTVDSKKAEKQKQSCDSRVVRNKQA